MSIANLSAMFTTPEFYSGLVTGALISRTVRKAVKKRIEESVSGGGNK